MYPACVEPFSGRPGPHDDRHQGQPIPATRHRMRGTDLTSGKSHSFGGEYVELTPYQRIRFTDRFDDPNLPGEIRVTVDLKQAFCGTELSITQEGIPDVIPAEACYLGWQESLVLLAMLVEVEIPD